MSDSLFGWDLLYKTIENSVTRESDVIIALAHWFLIRNATFRCVGVGDDKSLNPDDIGSELLPDGWNEMGDSYALRYVYNNELYILLGARSDNTIVLNLLDVKTSNISNVAIHPKEAVKEIKGGIRTMIPNVTELLDRFKKELIDPVFTGPKKEVTTQTQVESGPNHERNILPSLLPKGGIIGSSYTDTRGVDPLRDIGRSDLDPLGRGGSGMLFQPPGSFGPGHFAPPGGFGPDLRFRPPPGARFDPFSPPDEFTRRNPNNNHFRPPPDFDDMFM